MAGDIVEIARFFDIIEGELACARLRAAGIKGYLQTDNAGGIHPELNFTRGVRLMVLAADEDLARELIGGEDPDGG